MTSVFMDTVASLPHLPGSFFAQAASGPNDATRHRQLAGDNPLLTKLELRQPTFHPARARDPRAIRVGAWNLERCKFVEDTARVVRESECDILLGSEMDVGMARSGNRHTVADLASLLGLGYLFGVEFIEIGMGNQTEAQVFADASNANGLHGNAILSPWPLSAPRMIHLEDGGGSWFSLDWHHRRVGGRNAVAATVALDGYTIAFAVVHLESLPDAERRHQQAKRLLAAVDELEADAFVVAGDFNTSELPPQESRADALPDWFTTPERFEPLFAEFAARGFMWHEANLPRHTRRSLPNGKPRPPFRRADWFFVKGLDVSEPRIWPALGSANQAVSDHELITVDLTLRATSGGRLRSTSRAHVT